MTFVPALRSISSQEFEGWPASMQVIAHDHARRFGALALPDDRQSVALSWRSDSIEPVIVVRDASEIWLAVDQRLACVAPNGRILVSLGLASFVLQLRCFAVGTVVLCEAESIVFNRDFTVRSIRALSDLPCDVSERAGQLFVSLDDGAEVNIG